MTTLSEISAQLAVPFAVEDIDLLPKGKIERDGKTLCMALPYADPRVYQDRLNKLAPGEWETPPPIALTVGDKLICYVTVIICGVRHTDAGEAGHGENQGTEAFSQAFKRACSQFGLGRYLYGLEKEWVPYDPKRKQIDLNIDGIQNVVKKMYAKAGIAMSQSKAKPTEQQRTSIQKASLALGREVKCPETYEEAKELIASLTTEYREAKANGALPSQNANTQEKAS